MESWKQETMLQLALDYIDIIIDEMPTVDAVEVVRCKDCKYHHYICLSGFLDRKYDDFCSYGERREGE